MALSDLAEVYETDVLVLGGGLAGAFAAIKAKQSGAGNVTLVDKSVAGKSGCSTFAAGVIASFFPHQDSLSQWMEELCELGGYLNDQVWLEVLLNEIFEHVEEMARWGVNFLRKPDGDYERIVGRGGGPGRGLRNIMFHGPQLMEPVIRQVRRLGVSRYDRTMITDLIIKDGRCVGAAGFDVLAGAYRVFKSKVTILSAGGTYSKGSFVSHKNLAGDPHAMCLRAGVEMQNFDFTSRNQSCTEFDTEGMNMFVALGGRFVNALGDEFLPRYDPVLGNRATKPYMAMATALEVKLGHGPIYMDMSHFTPDKVEKLRQVLPLASLILQRAGVMVGDEIIRKLAWGPAGVGTVAFGGGARIDTRCTASIPGLYAAGDSAARHAAGHNEMGAGALTWAIVSGARAGRFAAEDAPQFDIAEVKAADIEEKRQITLAPLGRKLGIEPEQVVLAIQEALFPWDVLEVRHAKRMQEALDKIIEIQELQIPRMCAYDPHYLILANEARSLAITAELILRAGLMRQESRCNLREDYPDLDNINWLKWIIIRPEGKELHFRTEDIPIDDYPVNVKRQKYLHPCFAAAGFTHETLGVD